LYFIHGTALEKPEFKISRGKGRGDFGIGLYTFLLCGEDGDWGLESAIQRANQHGKFNGLPPAIVYLGVRRANFIDLNIASAVEDSGASIFKELYPDSITGFDVVVGPVFAGQGRKVNDSLPMQYKFEGNGLNAIEIIKVKRIPRWELDQANAKRNNR
jgi:hypothetical protein